jgi:uncharacterized protein
MKVGIFFSGPIDEQIEATLRICRSEEIDASAYRFRREWAFLDPAEVSFNFGALTHVLLRGTETVLSAEWLPFVAGFALGRGRDSCILGPLDVDGLPTFLKNLPVLLVEEELHDYLSQEHLRLERERTLEAAREEIRAAGLPETEDAFAGAAVAGDTDSIRNFLKVGFSPDIRDRKGVPLLVLAIRNNNPAAGEVLLSRGADPNAMSEDRGTTALMEAASLGNLHIVEMLLSHGANPDLRSKSGRTALMLAVSEGNREVAAGLLSSGADREIVDDLGMTALGYAKLFKLEDLFETKDQA